MVENEKKVLMAGRRTKKIGDFKEGNVSARNSRYTRRTRRGIGILEKVINRRQYLTKYRGDRCKISA